ncbi:hypothetical protein TWF481_000866 [Arthrobotrys musiformis]|uniref:Protein kinase domain-containing protein n=1 Tax=Arthrobotrys musiformis TaxID=47236 RepID=A0AAV9WQ04_9PEZI
MDNNDQPRDADDTQLTVGPWRLGRTLGEGASGRVCLGKHHKTGRFAAIKVINKDKTQGTTTSIQEAGCDIEHAIEREIVVMNIPAHPNTIELYEIWDSRDEIYLVLEYVSGGDLLQYMTRKRFLPEKEVARLFKQLITGLSHLHRFSIYHRDLKHENLMMDQNGNVKIGDFGMAALQPDGEKFTSACGSPNYAAPEVVQGLPYNGSTADIWSSGVILYGMLTHQLPFDDPDTSTILGRIVWAEYKLPRSISLEAADLIKRMLELDPDRRIKLECIPEHPFLTKHRSRIPSQPLDGAIRSHVVQDLSQHTGMKEARQIDMDIVTRLKALWMSQDEAVLANKVLFQEKSQERLFYDLLLQRHIGGLPTKTTNDIVLQLEIPTAPVKSGFYGSNFTKVDREAPFIYREALVVVGTEPESMVPGWARKFAGLDLNSGATGDENRFGGRAPGGNGQPNAPRGLRSPLTLLPRGLDHKHGEPTSHIDNDIPNPSQTLPVEEVKSVLSGRFGQLGVLKGCLKALSGRKTYKRKVRKIQSRRSVLFTGSQIGTGNGGPHRLLRLGKQSGRPVGPVSGTGTGGVSTRISVFMQEKPQKEEPFPQQKATQGELGSLHQGRKGSHVGRAPLALLNTSQRKQTIFFHEPVTKSRKRLNSIFSIWQSYGAGHVRMSESNIVWTDASVKKRSRRPFVCTVRLAELDGGTTIAVSRESGSAARLNGVVAELIELLSAYNIRRKEEDVGSESVC